MMMNGSVTDDDLCRWRVHMTCGRRPMDLFICWHTCSESHMTVQVHMLTFHSAD